MSGCTCDWSRLLTTPGCACNCIGVQPAATALVGTQVGTRNATHQIVTAHCVITPALACFMIVHCSSCGSWPSPLTMLPRQLPGTDWDPEPLAEGLGPPVQHWLAVHMRPQTRLLPAAHLHSGFTFASVCTSLAAQFAYALAGSAALLEINMSIRQAQACGLPSSASASDSAADP